MWNETDANDGDGLVVDAVPSTENRPTQRRVLRDRSSKTRPYYPHLLQRTVGHMQNAIQSDVSLPRQAWKRQETEADTNYITLYFSWANVGLLYANLILSTHRMFPGQPVKGGIQPADIWMMICVGWRSSRKSTSSIHTIWPSLLWVL